MRTYDLAPFYRSSVGFDNLFRLLDASMKLDDSSGGYPPYNIEKKSDDEYRISMAVAGFSENELNVTVHGNALLVTGKQQETEEQEEKNFLHRGIAARSFERRFQLADHVQIENATLKDGLLHIDLVRNVPESAKPRSISINGTAPKTLDNQTSH